MGILLTMVQKSSKSLTIMKKINIILRAYLLQFSVKVSKMVQKGMQGPFQIVQKNVAGSWG